MKSSSLFTLFFTILFTGLTVSVAQAQLRDSIVDTTLDASEIIISEKMLRNASKSKAQLSNNQNQSIFDKPVTRAFLGLGKSIIGNKVDTPKSYSGFRPDNTAELIYGYRTFERTSEFPIFKRSYSFFRTELYN